MQDIVKGKRRTAMITPRPVLPCSLGSDLLINNFARVFC
jgi:hypothetical protein